MTLPLSLSAKTITSNSNGLCQFKVIVILLPLIRILPPLDNLTGSVALLGFCGGDVFGAVILSLTEAGLKPDCWGEGALVGAAGLGFAFSTTGSLVSLQRTSVTNFFSR